MKKLWNKIKSHFSGWPEGAVDRIKKVEEKVEEKKPKGLNPKKKKKKAKKKD